MRGELTAVEIDRRIAGLARRQFGVVGYVQLIAAGIPRGAIERRIAGGRLLRLHRGVYAVGHTAPRREARWLAAVLACGPEALLSLLSAGCLWKLREADGPLPDVSAATRRRHRGIATHRAALTRADRRVRLGIPVTSPARTLVDLSFALDADEFERTAREAQFRKLFVVRDLQEVLRRRPSRVVRQLLDDIAPTQTTIEDVLLRVCDRHGIPRPRTQEQLAIGRVDFIWPEQRLIVETDGWQAHRTPAAFQRDRTVTNGLQLSGYLVLRFTWADLERRPEMVARQIRAALERSLPHAMRG
jgi:very-short-patch-repair endonuclease